MPTCCARSAVGQCIVRGLIECLTRCCELGKDGREMVDLGVEVGRSERFEVFHFRVVCGTTKMISASDS